MDISLYNFLCFGALICKIDFVLIPVFIEQVPKDMVRTYFTEMKLAFRLQLVIL